MRRRRIRGRDPISPLRRPTPSRRHDLGGIVTIEAAETRIASLRAELRAWLGEHRQPALAGRSEYEVENDAWRNPDSPLFDDYTAWERASLEARLVCPHWPEEYG